MTATVRHRGGWVLAAYVGISSLLPGHRRAPHGRSVMSPPTGPPGGELMSPGGRRPGDAGDSSWRWNARVPNANRGGGQGGRRRPLPGADVGAHASWAFIGALFIAMLNALIEVGGGWWAFPGLSSRASWGGCSSPLAWILGVPWSDASTVCLHSYGIQDGGERVRGLPAALRMCWPGGDAPLEPRSIIIATYAFRPRPTISSIYYRHPTGGSGESRRTESRDLAQAGASVPLRGLPSQPHDRHRRPGMKSSVENTHGGGPRMDAGGGQGCGWRRRQGSLGRAFPRGPGASWLLDRGLGGLADVVEFARSRSPLPSFRDSPLPGWRGMPDASSEGGSGAPVPARGRAVPPSTRRHHCLPPCVARCEVGGGVGRIPSLVTNAPASWDPRLPPAPSSS